MVSAANVLGLVTRNRANAGRFFVNSTVPAVLAVMVLMIVSGGWAGLGGSSLPTTAGTTAQASLSTGIDILPLSSATPISPEFWGINLEPTRPFNVSDAHALATTPVTYIRYPGGVTADEMNYTSGIITNATGVASHAATPPGNFTKSCEAIRCHAIFDLPAEIARPATAAYYVSYVEHTLGFTPSYWEIGNTPSAWNHYDQPWSTWATAPKSKVTIPEYTSLLLNFTAAVRAVDPTTPIIAPAIGQGTSNGIPTCSTWCGPVVASDGANLSGVPVHSYVADLVPADTSLPSYFSRLTTSLYALPTVVPTYRAIIAHNFSGTLPLFLDEVGVVNSFTGSQETFGNYTKQLYGGLFQAAEVTQLLALDVANVDWFAWASTSGFGWYGLGGGPWSPTGQVFQTFMTQLYGQYDPTTVLGSSTLYAAATTDGTNLSLLVVNVNTTGSFSFPLGALFSGKVNETSWAVGSKITVYPPAANTTATDLPLSVSVWRGHGIGSASAKYSVTFTESGLSTGTSWSVTLNGNLESSTGTSISFSEPDGAYSYSVGSVSGYTSSPSSGTVTVNGVPVGVPITFTAATLAVTVSPTQGPVGSTVTVSGTGFAPSTKLKSLVFDSKTIASCTSGSLTAGAQGTYSCTFKVPTGTSGTTVKATNVGGKAATGKFTVTTPKLTVSPVKGAVGSTVTVSGTGFSLSTKLKSLVFDSKTITGLYQRFADGGCQGDFQLHVEGTEWDVWDDGQSDGCGRQDGGRALHGDDGLGVGDARTRAGHVTPSDELAEPERCFRDGGDARSPESEVFAVTGWNSNSRVVGGRPAQTGPAVASSGSLAIPHREPRIAERPH